MQQSVSVVGGRPPENRLHSTLDYRTPAEYEQAHYATLNREPQPV